MRVRLRSDDKFFEWFVFALFVAMVVIGFGLSELTRRAARPDGAAAICRLNKGVPVTNYYGEFACVAENKP